MVANVKRFINRFLAQMYEETIKATICSEISLTGLGND
jgi:hypothetical protein